jgi:hypothetical protein
MDAWRPKHVEDYDTIKCLWQWKWMCIKLVTLLWYVFLRCPKPRLHIFLSSHWTSLRILSVMAFFIPSIQFFFSLPRALFCFGIQFTALLCNLLSAILWTWPYHVSWFCSISFMIVSSSPICCFIVTFLILSFIYILDADSLTKLNQQWKSLHFVGSYYIYRSKRQ